MTLIDAIKEERKVLSNPIVTKEEKSESWQKVFDKIKDLIKSGADVNMQDEHGYTALMLSYSTQTTQLLIEAGADVNAKDKRGHNAFWYARNHTDISVKSVVFKHPSEEVYGEIIQLLKDAGTEEN